MRYEQTEALFLSNSQKKQGDSSYFFSYIKVVQFSALHTVTALF